MIANQALESWLGSRDARAATQAAIGRLGAGLAAMPAFDALRTGLAPAVEAGAEAVLALARRFVEDNEAIAALVGSMTAAAMEDPFCRPPLQASRNEVQDGLMLFGHAALTIQLAVVSADALAIKRRSGGRVPIPFTGQRTFFRFLKGGGAVLSIWESPPIDSGFSAAADPRCRLRERRPLADGDSLELDGRREAFLVDRAESDLVYIFASTTLGASPVALDYDPVSLELAATSSTDDAGSRIQMMLALLRTMGRRDAAPLFAQQLGVPHFHARWQAIRELLALDAEFALPHLRDMAESDPHPEVRFAAAQTLAAFFPEEPPCPA